MRFIVKNEGLLGLFKGIGPQISKGLLVQGLLMMTKERYVLFSLLPRLLHFSHSQICLIQSTQNFRNPRTNNIHSRMELLFILLFRYLRKLRSEQLQKAADLIAKRSLPILSK